MKRATIALSLLFLTSCGTAFDPLEPNDRLRAVCYGVNDDTLRSLLSTIDADRRDGVPLSVEHQAAYYYCGTIDCANCAIALVDQVYRGP